jgi:ribosomal protein S27E
MKEEIRCVHCGSSQTRYRIKTSDRICYVCGKVEKLKPEESDGS